MLHLVNVVIGSETRDLLLKIIILTNSLSNHYTLYNCLISCSVKTRLKMRISSIFPLKNSVVEYPVELEPTVNNDVSY
jgi:hypothetical protein